MNKCITKAFYASIWLKINFNLKFFFGVFIIFLHILALDYIKNKVRFSGVKCKDLRAKRVSNYLEIYAYGALPHIAYNIYIYRYISVKNQGSRLKGGGPISTLLAWERNNISTFSAPNPPNVAKTANF